MLARQVHRKVLRTAIAAALVGLLAASSGVATAEAGKSKNKRGVVCAQTNCAVVHRHPGRYRVPVYRPVPVCAPYRVVRAPWYDSAPRSSMYGVETYFHAGVGVFFGGLALSFEVGTVAPVGFVYVDPVCGERWQTLDGYRRHAHRMHHQPVLIAEAVDPYGRDGQGHRRRGR